MALSAYSSSIPDISRPCVKYPLRWNISKRLEFLKFQPRSKRINLRQPPVFDYNNGFDNRRGPTGRKPNIQRVDPAHGPEPFLESGQGLTLLRFLASLASLASRLLRYRSVTRLAEDFDQPAGSPAEFSCSTDWVGISMPC